MPQRHHGHVDGSEITVAVCTWNRADLLAQSLGELVRMSAPRLLRWDLLVVDNASTDNTKGVVESFHDRLPIRYVFEPKLGLSNARNCAVNQARGRFIVWIDDDVRVDPGWLAGYSRGISENPQADIFGGVIEPLFEVPPPTWMKQVWPMISKYHAIRSIPEGGGSIESECLPNGANFGIRAEVQRHYRYDPSQGRMGHELFSGEESTMIRRILNDGGKGIWLPDARVRHFLPASRMTLKYLRRTVRDSGKQRTLEEIAAGHNAADGVRLFGTPRWLWKKVFEMQVSYLTKRLRNTPEVWMPAMLRASWTWGEICGHRASQGS